MTPETEREFAHRGSEMTLRIAYSWIAFGFFLGAFAAWLVMQ